MKLFGFEIKRADDDEKKPVSFADPINDDGALTISNSLGGFYSTGLDMEGSAKSEAELITRYRNMAMQPEITKDLISQIEPKITEMVNDGLNPILVTTSDLRLALRRFLEPSYPQLYLLSYQEIPAETMIEPYAVIVLGEDQSSLQNWVPSVDSGTEANLPDQVLVQ